MEKNGKWFLELILSVLLLVFTTLVTLMARSEEDRGLTVRALGPMMTGGAAQSSRTPEAAGKPQRPVVLPPTNGSKPAPDKQVSTLISNQGLAEVVGSLGIWASRLDGQLTSKELENITGQVGGLWTDTNRNLKDYLKEVNEKMNSQGPAEVLGRALDSLGQAAFEKKTQILGWMVDLMQKNGLSLAQVQDEVGRWVAGLKLNPGDIFPR